VLVALACGVSAAGAGVALAQAAAGTPPAWEVLVRCAEMGDKDDRLACYDEAMRAAGYAPRPEAVAAARRRLFGLRAPQISILKHKEAEAPARAAEGAAPSEAAAAPAPATKRAPAPQEDENGVTVTLAKVALQGDGKLLMVTEEGQIWEQTDTDRLVSLPKPGLAMPIHRGTFGGYFCDVSKYKSVRCERVR